MAKREPLPVPGGETPAWLKELRAAAFNGINAGDVKEIVAGIVERAKKGDQAAIRFVFDYLLQAAPTSPKQLTQHNHYYRSRPDKKAKGRPGSTAKLDALAARASTGRALFPNGHK